MARVTKTHIQWKIICYPFYGHETNSRKKLAILRLFVRTLVSATTREIHLALATPNVHISVENIAVGKPSPKNRLHMTYCPGKSCKVRGEHMPRLYFGGEVSILERNARKP